MYDLLSGRFLGNIHGSDQLQPGYVQSTLFEAIPTFGLCVSIVIELAVLSIFCIVEF